MKRMRLAIFLATATMLASIAQSLVTDGPRLVLKTSNAVGGDSQPMRSDILRSGRKLDVYFDQTLIQSDLINRFGRSTDLGIEAKGLKEAVTALRALKVNAEALKQFNGRSASEMPAFQGVTLEIARSLNLLRNIPSIAARINAALDNPFGPIDDQIALVIGATDEYVRETLERLLVAEKLSAVELSLVIRMLRDPNYQQPVPLDSSLVLDKASKSAFDNLAPDLMGEGADRAAGFRLVGFQLLGLSTLPDSIKVFEENLNAIQPRQVPQAITDLKQALETVSGDLKQASQEGQSASAFLDGALGNVNVLKGLVRTAPDAIKTALGVVDAELWKAQITALIKPGNDLIADIDSMIKGTASFLGIARSFEEIDRWSNSLNAANLQPVIDALAGKELRFGDKIEVTLVASPPEGATVTLGSASLRVFTSGLYRRDEPTVFYAFPQSGDTTLQPTIGLGQSAMFYPQWGSASSYDFPPYGFGLTGSILNFDEDGSYEFGLGLTLGFLNNLVVAGYGYNLTHETPYIFAGLKLRIK